MSAFEFQFQSHITPVSGPGPRDNVYTSSWVDVVLINLLTIVMRNAWAQLANPLITPRTLHPAPSTRSTLFGRWGELWGGNSLYTSHCVFQIQLKSLVMATVGCFDLLLFTFMRFMLANSALWALPKKESPKRSPIAVGSWPWPGAGCISLLTIE